MALFNNKEHERRIEELEKKVDKLDDKYAIKLVQTIVFGLCATAGTTAVGAWVANILGLLGG